MQKRRRSFLEHKYEYNDPLLVLPKYEVTIDAPPYIRDWNACKRIEVKAR